MLAILAAGLNRDKGIVRYTVGHYYLAFSVIQLLTIFVSFGAEVFSVTSLLTPMVSVAFFLLFGYRMFLRAGQNSYKIALPSFIALYGIAIVVKSLGF